MSNQIKRFQGAWEDKEIATWLLNIANDMRRAKGDETLNDLIPSIPRNETECIIANAFNYGCSVQPEGGIIKFQNQADRDTYLKVMGFPEAVVVDDQDQDDEGCYYTIGFDPTYWYANEAPMTPELVSIAIQFDNGKLFKQYDYYYWAPEARFGHATHSDPAQL